MAKISNAIKVTSSHEEGVSRTWAVNTKEFIADEQGNLKALKVVNVEWDIDANGRASGFKEIEGTEKVYPCELVLLGHGFLISTKNKVY